MRKIVKVVIGIVVVLFVLGIIGTFSGSRNEQTQKVESNVNLVQSEPESLFPTRTDVNTEWVIGEPTDISPAISGNFTDSSKLTLHKNDANGPIGVVIEIYKFPSDATEFYISEINEDKERGGYTEINTFGIAGECYGMKIFGNAGEQTRIKCHKKNIYFYVLASTTYFVSTEDTAKNIADIIAGKI